MTINSQSFLPSPKNLPKGLIANKTSKKISASTLTLYKEIEVKVIAIDSFLNKSLVIKREQIKSEKNVTEKQKFKNTEKELEKKSPSKKNLKVNLPKPRLGIFDWIRNFVTKVFLGLIVVKFIKYLPKLLSLIPIINNAMDFIIDWGGKLLDGLVTFIDWGYKAVDASRSFVTDVFGKDGAKKFDEFSAKFSDIVNYSLIAAMLIGDIGDGIMGNYGGGNKPSNVAGDVAGDVIQERITQQITQRAAQGVATQTAGAAAVGPLAAAGIVAGVGLLASALGEGMFQLKKLSKGTVDWIQNNPLFSNPLGKLVLAPLNVGLWALNGIGLMFDVIGAPFRYGVELIRFAMMKMSGDTKGMMEQSKNLGKFDARVRDGFREQTAAFAAPLLRMIGKEEAAKNLETEGSWGSLYGDKAVKNMYGHSEGGVTRGGEYVEGIAQRKVKKAKPPRTIKTPVAKLSPGKSVGGTEKDDQTNKPKIEVFYPKGTAAKEVKPYDFVSKSYKTTSNTSFLGSLFGLATKTIFGDKPSQIDYQNISFGINSWINTIIDRVKSGYRAYAGGGLALTEVEEQDLRSWLRVVIQNSVNPRVNQILNDFVKQLTLKSPGGTRGPSRTPRRREEREDPNAEFQGQADFVIGDNIAHGFAGRSGNGTDTSDSKVGRKPSEVLEFLKSKGEALKGKLIDLSTGIANSKEDWAIVEEQLKYLQSMGARVRLLGVGRQWDERSGGNQVNSKLQQLASRYHAYFYGGHNASGDRLGVSGRPQDYEELKTRLASTAVSGEGGDIGPGGGQLRFGRTGSTRGLEPGWSHAHFENLRGGMTSQSPTEANIQKLVNTIMPAVKKMISSGLKPELARGEPFTSGKDDAYYERLIRLGVSRHTHSGPKTAVDINMPGFPFVPFALKNVRNEPNTGQGINALLGNSDTVALFHLSYKPTGYAFHGKYITGLKPKIIKTHDDEYVIDKDSVDLFGLPFIDLINRIENKEQLKKNVDKLMRMLDYEYEGSKTYIFQDDGTYYSQPTMAYIGLGNMSTTYSQDDSWHFDSLNAQ